MPVSDGTRSTSNWILNALPPEDLRRLLPLLKSVPWTLRKTLCRPGRRLDCVYFPSSGVCSMVTTMSDGRTVEVATIGNEGLVGLIVFLGGEKSHAEAFVQVQGSRALAMPADIFRKEIDARGAFYRAVSRYAQAFETQVLQTTACNLLHSVEERCARWLLMSHDRVETHEIAITHEFIGMMLGARRPTVSLVLGVLARAGLIRIGTKRITILDRTGLQCVACECYEVVRAEFARLLPRSPGNLG